MRLAIFDVDGVLADVRHRLHHLDGQSPDWDLFFAGAPDDPPLELGVALAHQSAAECELAYLTGRPERCRPDTVQWLQRHGLPDGRLLMRADGDRRVARLLKLELIREFGAIATVAVVVDDDASVCAALRAAGYPVLHADWMGESSPLRDAQEREGRT